MAEEAANDEPLIVRRSYLNEGRKKKEGWKILGKERNDFAKELVAAW
jgi:hypothetical protein